MLDYGKLVESVSLDRNTIFTSLSSKDKDIAMRLIDRLDAMKINHWCMYQRDGRDTNIGGDDYRKTIRKALESCCVLVFLMSQNSLYSAEVKSELEQVMRMKLEDTTHPYIKIFPIFLDDTPLEEIPKDIANLAEIKKEIIVRRFSVSSTEEELSTVCEEIREQYVNAVFENICRKTENIKKSQRFNELLSRCVRGKCTANTISDDIKNSTEICTDSHLYETHVLSNEMIEYDCNTYSCMIIATNLLGNEVGKGMFKTFDPKKNGVKYYYYVPTEEEANRDTTFRKIKDFIAKTPESRKEVTRLIRSEFCSRNKLDVFFQEFNGKTVDDLFEQYNIENEHDRDIFKAFFDSDLAQNFFDYSALREVLGVPDEFIDWLRGTTERYSYDTQIETSYEFIRFISEFAALLEKSRDTVNTVLLDALHIRVTYLERIKRLEDWQTGVASDVTLAESKKLVNFLLDYTADNDQQGAKKFPRLAAWMQFYRDKNGNVCDIPESVVQAACDNLISVPIKENKLLHLCYSFTIFVEKTGLSGAWYSTGQGLVNGKEDNTVTTYNIDAGTNAMKELSDAFFYLLYLNPEAEKVLETTKSELLKRKRGKRQ